MSRRTLIPGLAALCLAGAASVAHAQSLAVTPQWVSGGYNGAAAAVTQSYDPSTRDAYGNRIVSNGEIVTAGVSSVADRFGAAAAGCGTYVAGAGSSTSATAIGNVSQIQVQGSWNTVVASVNQTNSGPVTATVASK